MTSRILLALAGMALICASAGIAPAAESDWPREISTPRGRVTVYQPQLESLTKDRIVGRSAVSVAVPGQDQPVFGTVWLLARIETDRDERTVSFTDITVPTAVFPGAKQEQIDMLRTFLTSEAPGWDLGTSLDRLLAMCDAMEREPDATREFRTDPPAILYRDHPAVLVNLDGEAQLQPVEGTDLMRVVNTPYFVVLSGATKQYYLSVGKSWMRAPEITGPWAPDKDVPKAVTDLATKMKVEAEEEEYTAEKPPEVIFATKPTELIQTDGKAKYRPVDETTLQYVGNSEQDVFVDTGTQHHFVLLSGRWYGAKTLSDGDWTFVSPDKLPADFGRIPPESEKGHVLTSVPGTQEAREAVLETYIPQTNRIDREHPVDVTVEYDGPPKFEPIENTKLEYAVNTAQSVLRYGSFYYLCEDAVWYLSSSPQGPWAICTDVPSAIYDIPPDNPNYNTTYVYVYDSSPRYVYVGYYPGYIGCYVYRGCVIYGTGWWYRPWLGRRYYPRPCTWGFGVRYNPWTGGWGFRVGYRGPHGGIGVGVGTRTGRWWGAAGYRNVHHRHKSAHQNLYHRPSQRPGSRPGKGPGDRAGTKPVDRPGAGVRPGTKPADRPATGARPGTKPADRPARPATSDRKKNNVYTDKSGNIYRRTDSGWQRREGMNWKHVGGGDKPNTGQRPSTGQRPAATPRPSTADLNRQHQARQRGTYRTNQYRRSYGGGSRGVGSRGGGGRGGGGRR